MKAAETQLQAAADAKAAEVDAPHTYSDPPTTAAEDAAAGAAADAAGAAADAVAVRGSAEGEGANAAEDDTGSSSVSSAAQEGAAADRTGEAGVGVGSGAALQRWLETEENDTFSTKLDEEIAELIAVRAAAVVHNTPHALGCIRCHTIAFAKTGLRQRCKTASFSSESSLLAWIFIYA